MFACYTYLHRAIDFPGNDLISLFFLPEITKEESECYRQSQNIWKMPVRIKIIINTIKLHRKKNLTVEYRDPGKI